MGLSQCPREPRGEQGISERKTSQGSSDPGNLRESEPAQEEWALQIKGTAGADRMGKCK